MFTVNELEFIEPKLTRRKLGIRQDSTRAGPMPFAPAMEADAHIAELQAALRRELDAEQVRLVKIVRGLTVAEDWENTAYAARTCKGGPRPCGLAV